MTRRPVGNLPQDSSATALASYLASRFAGVPADRSSRNQWLADLKLAVRSNGLERAGAHASRAVAPWLLVDDDELPLDLEKALITIPGTGRAREELLHALRELGAARQIIVTRSRRDIWCVLLYRRSERDGVFAAIERLADEFTWEDVLIEDRQVEVAAWLGLALRCAVDEGLLQGAGELASGD